MAKILVVDDHPLVRQGIAQFINQEKDMTVCGEASDGYEALSEVSTEFSDGSMTFLTGHSGAGKSTFLKLLICAGASRLMSKL